MIVFIDLLLDIYLELPLGRVYPTKLTEVSSIF
nr:MAG TPA: hypothetical protein [Caudoviricetes sp.]DAY32626.1 MAG TPA: hypothetical protein [Caudoviricetes sp.]